MLDCKVGYRMLNVRSCGFMRVGPLLVVVLDTGDFT